jgi:hypothetical protein
MGYFCLPAAVVLLLVAPFFLTLQLCDALWRIRRRSAVPRRSFLQWSLPVVFAVPATYVAWLGGLRDRALLALDGDGSTP